MKKIILKTILNNWILKQLREELWEINDKETIETIKKYKSWDKNSSISLDDFKKKYT